MKANRWWQCKESTLVGTDKNHDSHMPPPQHWARRAIPMRSCMPEERQQQQPHRDASPPHRGRRRHQRRSDHRKSSPQHRPEESHHAKKTKKEKKKKRAALDPTWKKLLFSYDLANVLVQCQDEITIPAHQNILAAASPTLAQWLHQNEKGAPHPSKGKTLSSSSSPYPFIDWKVPYPAYVMRAVLSFIYLGPPEPLHQRLMLHEPWTLWKVAQDYQLLLLLQELSHNKAPQNVPPTSMNNNNNNNNKAKAAKSISRGGAVAIPPATRTTRPAQEILAQENRSSHVRRRAQSSTSTTTSSSSSSSSSSSASSTTSSSSCFHGIPQAALLQQSSFVATAAPTRHKKLPDKYLVSPIYSAKMDDDDDDHNDDHDESQSSDNSSLVSEGSLVLERMCHTNHHDEEDDDDDESSHPWLSNYLFKTAVSNNLCQPSPSVHYGSARRPVLGRDYSSQYDDDEEDHSLLDDDDDDDYFYEYDKEEEEEEEQERVGLLPPTLKTVLLDSMMCDLSRRHGVHPTTNRPHASSSTLPITMEGLNHLGLLPSSHLVYPPLLQAPAEQPSASVASKLGPVRASAQAASKSGPVPPSQGASKLGPIPLIPASTTSITTKPSTQSKEASGPISKLSFRDKYQRKIQNQSTRDELEKSDYHGPNVVSPQQQSQEPKQHPRPRANYYSMEIPPTDCSPNSSFNVDKIELLNVESSGDQHDRRQQQQQQEHRIDDEERSLQNSSPLEQQRRRHEVQMIIRGPTMTLPNDSASHSTKPAARMDEFQALVANRGPSTLDRSFYDFPDHGVPAIVSPTESTPTAATFRRLSPPRIHRVVTPASCESVHNRKQRGDVTKAVAASRQHDAPNQSSVIITETDQGDNEIHPINQPQDLPPPFARARLRDYSTVDTEMVALVLSRLELKQSCHQPRYRAFTPEQTEDNYEHLGDVNSFHYVEHGNGSFVESDTVNSFHYVEHGNGSFVESDTLLTVSVRDEDDVEVAISSTETNTPSPLETPKPALTEPRISRREMIHKLRRVVALYKKPTADNSNNLD